MDAYAWLRFERFALPMRAPAVSADPPQADWAETQVQPFQAAVLIGGLRATDGIDGCVAEIGAWRGVTTRYLALAAGGSKVVAVDRWVRAKGDRNYEAFLRRTRALPNVAHERSHSGAAARGWTHGPIRFLFIDAGHDYANVAHDLAAWRPHVAPGGIIAMHDCDDPGFAGCRLAIYEMADQFELFAHVSGLALLRVRA
jgi:predicted O-methyltransferase YrrM